MDGTIESVMDAFKDMLGDIKKDFSDFRNEIKKELTEVKHDLKENVDLKIEPVKENVTKNRENISVLFDRSDKHKSELNEAMLSVRSEIKKEVSIIDSAVDEINKKLAGSDGKQEAKEKVVTSLGKNITLIIGILSFLGAIGLTLYNLGLSGGP